MYLGGRAKEHVVIEVDKLLGQAGDAVEEALDRERVVCRPLGIPVCVRVCVLVRMRACVRACAQLEDGLMLDDRDLRVRRVQPLRDLLEQQALSHPNRHTNVRTHGCHSTGAQHGTARHGTAC